MVPRSLIALTAVSIESCLNAVVFENTSNRGFGTGNAVFGLSTLEAGDCVGIVVLIAESPESKVNRPMSGSNAIGLYVITIGRRSATHEQSIKKSVM